MSNWVGHPLQVDLIVVAGNSSTTAAGAWAGDGAGAGCAGAISVLESPTPAGRETPPLETLA